MVCLENFIYKLTDSSLFSCSLLVAISSAYRVTLFVCPSLLNLLLPVHLIFLFVSFLLSFVLLLQLLPLLTSLFTLLNGSALFCTLRNLIETFCTFAISVTLISFCTYNVHISNFLSHSQKSCQR